MSNQIQKQPIENAEEVIERFGGIRPMAKKINVAVTTVQGWKKRNSIPAARYDDIVRAAQEHDIALDDVVGSESAPGDSSAPPANENGSSEGFAAARTSSPASSSFPPSAAQGKRPADHSRPSAKSQGEQASSATAAIVGGALVALSLAAVIVLLWPGLGGKNDAERIAELEQKVQELEGNLADAQQDNGFFGALVPKALSDKITDLQGQAQRTQESVNSALERVQEVSNDVLGEDAGTLEERLVKLEEHVGEISGSPQIAALLGRIQGFTATEDGQSQLQQSVSELSAFLGVVNTGTAEQLDSALEQAREQSTAVNETLSGVPGTDLKAAALLLGMTQFRSSLNRDNQPFEDDLQLLVNLTGENNPELRTALERLAPYAQEGVLTPGGLTEEFKGLTGDVVVASLKGEDVSIQDRAQARFGEMFQLEKDGELVTGTPTQATLAKTNDLLEQGDLAAAIASMKTLDGPAAEAAVPWMDKAQATLLAQQLKDFFGQAINKEAFGSAVSGLTAQGGKSLEGRTTLVQDEASGINILRIEKSPFESLPKASSNFGGSQN